MQFPAILALVLPVAVVAVPQASMTSSAPAPSSSASLETICESQAGPYSADCPRCLSLCATSSDPTDCYYSVFSEVNYIESVCEAEGGNNCQGQALDEVCPQ
ncbi:hypothetical protein F5Y16DRAFT_249124 [Xylariaceae sp. FL0255]|nr:hypothetical protein F5Y16DRAFT_249124 [Xylariaceae sp. FL0255]